MNWYGLWVLFLKEIWRFLKVVVQTVFTPMITALLYLFVFAHVIEGRHVTGHEHIDYESFLVPGLMMMSMIQNAFANSSSSLIQSKLMGSLTFLLMAPLSALEFYIAYVGASLVRGLLVGLSIYAAAVIFTDATVVHPWAVVTLGVLASLASGALGLMTGIWSEKFDQLAAIQNFVVLPLSFLSGVFYSIHSLPSLWQTLSWFNPFFYMIDGFRYGFIGVADAPIGLSIAVSGGFFLSISAVCIVWLQRGYRLRG